MNIFWVPEYLSIVFQYKSFFFHLKRKKIMQKEEKCLKTAKECFDQISNARSTWLNSTTYNARST